MPKKNHLINILLLVCSISLSLFLLEFSLGLIYSDQYSSSASTHMIGEVATSNIEFELVVHYDKYRFRWDSFAPIANTNNVLLIGDSFVEGIGLGDTETFTYQLNQLFLDKEYQFYGAGIGGSNIIDYLTIYKRTKSDLPFSFGRVIVFIYLGNDILEYSKLAADWKRANQVVDSKTLKNNIKYYIKSIFPNIVLTINKLLNKKMQDANGSLDLYVSWIDEHLDYYGRSLPISDRERSIMNDRFMRIEPHIREAMKNGTVNPWAFRDYVAPPSLTDYIFNMNSPIDHARFVSSMAILGELISFVQEDIDVVLIPSKFQVSSKYRDSTKKIMGENYPEKEFSNLFEINRYISEWFEENYTDITLIDLTDDIIADGDGGKYYYDIDEHLNPRGSNLVAKRIFSYFKRQSTIESPVEYQYSH